MKKHWMANLVVLLTCCFVIACGKSEKSDGWSEYKYRDVGFAISSPVMPLPQMPSGNTAAERQNSRAYGINFGNRTEIIITVGPISELGEEAPAGELLQRLKNMTIQGVPAKLVSEKEVSLDGNPGIEYEFEANTWHARDRVYIVKDRVFGMQSMAYGANPLPPTTDKVFDSLRLLK